MKKLVLASLILVSAVLIAGCGLVDQAKEYLPPEATKEAQQQLDKAKQAAEEAAKQVGSKAKELLTGSDSPAPDMTDPAYATVVNPWVNADPTRDYTGHCTWFAWGRAYEKNGIDMPMRGNAGSWYTDQTGNYLQHSYEPRADSIAVWQQGDYGHVAYVEKVDGESITINEANWGPDASYGQHGSGYTGASTTLTVSEMLSHGGKLLGYIYMPLP